MIAALYVEPDGCYAGLEGVELWDEARDARNYAGPWPVVAHPPCNRWSVIANVNQAKGLLRVGDDGGCFADALRCVRTYGGVIEHPARTHAWAAFGLPRPDSDGGWSRTMLDEGAVCHVEQGHYGCPAPKPTWLYAVGCELPSLRWGLSGATAKISRLATTKRVPRRSRLDPAKQIWQGTKAASATPPAFRDILIAMARSASRAHA